MGLRYHRRIELASGLYLNFAKTGLSVSVGKPGAMLNLSGNGVTASVGIPGTGLSYRTNLGSGASPPALKHGGSRSASPSAAKVHRLTETAIKTIHLGDLGTARAIRAAISEMERGRLEVRDRASGRRASLPQLRSLLASTELETQYKGNAAIVERENAKQARIVDGWRQIPSFRDRLQLENELQVRPCPSRECSQVNKPPAQEPLPSTPNEDIEAEALKAKIRDRLLAQATPPPSRLRRARWAARGRTFFLVVFWTAFFCTLGTYSCRYGIKNSSGFLDFIGFVLFFIPGLLGLAWPAEHRKYRDRKLGALAPKQPTDDEVMQVFLSEWNFETIKEVWRREHAAEINEWERQRAERQAEWERQQAVLQSAWANEEAARQAEWAEAERVRIERLKRLIAGDLTMVQEAIEEALEGLDAPFEMGCDLLVDDDGTIKINLSLPEIDTITPEKRRKLLSDGSLKEVNNPDREWYYRHAVVGLAYRVAAEVFAVAHTVTTVVVAGCTQRLSPKTGNNETEYVFELTISRSKFEKLAFDKLDPVEALSNFEHRIKTLKWGELKAIDPPSWVAEPIPDQ